MEKLLIIIVLITGILSGVRLWQVRVLSRRLLEMRVRHKNNTIAPGGTIIPIER